MNETLSTTFPISVLNVLPDAIIWVVPVFNDDNAITDFVVKYSNKTADSLINHPKGSLTGLQILRDGVPSFQASEGNFNHFLQVYQTGETMEYTFYAHHSKREFETVRQVLEGGVLSATRDRRGQREAERREREKTELLNGIVENAPVGIMVYETKRNDDGSIEDFTIKVYNKALHTLTGISEQDRRRLTFKELLTHINSQQIYQQYLNLIETGNPFLLEFLSPINHRWLNVSVVKLGDGFLIMVSDISENKNLQLELERSNASLEEFAYAASHDLQEPLRKISTFSDRLKNELEDKLSAKQAVMLDRMVNASNRMRYLIEDLLNYSQITANINLRDEVDLNTLLNFVLQDLETSITETGANIHINTFPYVKGDERQLRQMFQNLISNSLKYRKPEIKPQIFITGEVIDESNEVIKNFQNTPPGKYHLIRVSDNGIGFEQENAEKIFQVFQRLHGRAEYEGTGIGLAIVHKVVCNHKGYITVRSEPGKGATFFILLPMAP